MLGVKGEAEAAAQCDVIRPGEKISLKSLLIPIQPHCKQACLVGWVINNQAAFLFYLQLKLFSDSAALNHSMTSDHVEPAGM